MDKIKKILRVGSLTGEEWTSDDEKLYVVFEDETKEPQEVSIDNLDSILRDLANQQGMELGDDEEALVAIYEEAYEKNLLEQYDSSDPLQMEAFDKELADAKEKAGKHVEDEPEAGKDPAGVVIGGPSGPGGTGGETPPEGPDSEELDEEEDIKAASGMAAKIGAGVLAAGALIGAVSTIEQNVNVDKQVGQDDDTKKLDYDTASYDDIIASMDENDVRRQAAEKAMQVVNSFHEATHKEGNFRLEADGSTYLDLSFEEALVLTTFANYSDDPIALYDILGTFKFEGNQAQKLLDSARNKIITYYMNATEKSGLDAIFEDPQDQMLFSQMESSVLAFRAAHTTETSDQVLRNIYYNYILDHSTVAPKTNSMAKLLAFDTAYGGLILTESASVDHTQFLVFHGLGAEAETKKYVNEVLHLDYSSLSEEEKELYRRNIIEESTSLLNLTADGLVMNEENSTEEERTQNVSLTDLVDRTGLCNEVNDQISSAISSISTPIAKTAVISTRMLEVNRNLAADLRANGNDDLANQVENSLDAKLSDELKNQIGAVNATFTNAITEYEADVNNIYGVNRPTMAQIAKAAEASLGAKENYAGHLDNISTLVNNRRHGVEVTTVLNQDLTEEEKAAGIIGKTEDGTPVVNEEVVEGKTEEELEEFIKEHGKEETAGETVVEKTPVNYEDLTEEEKVIVEEQKVDISKYIDIENKFNRDVVTQYDAYADTYSYSFAFTTVTNTAMDNPLTYNISELDFHDAIVKIQAHGYSYIDENGEYARSEETFSLDASKDAQILNAAEVAAENFLNSLTAEEQEIVAAKFGTTWEDAREELKDQYTAGYVNGVQNIINTAIQEGNDEYELTRKVRADANAKTQESKNEQIAATSEGMTATTSEGEAVTAAGDTVGDSTELVGETDPAANVEPTVTSETETVSSELTGDPNIDIAYGQDEQPYTGNLGGAGTGEGTSTGTGTNGDESVQYTPAVQANVVDTTVAVEYPLNPSTTGEPAASDTSLQGDTVVADTSTQTDVTLSDEEALQEALKAYFDANIEEVSRGGRSR